MVKVTDGERRFWRDFARVQIALDLSFSLVSRLEGEALRVYAEVIFSVFQ